jgi:hypothetical protein
MSREKLRLTKNIFIIVELRQNLFSPRQLLRTRALLRVPTSPFICSAPHASEASAEVSWPPANEFSNFGENSLEI